jgi:hypothetical protein
MPVQQGKPQSWQAVLQQSSVAGMSFPSFPARDTAPSLRVWHGSSRWTVISHVGWAGTGQIISATANKRRR